jgi:hypothetical protein
MKIVENPSMISDRVWNFVHGFRVHAPHGDDAPFYRLSIVYFTYYRIKYNAIQDVQYISMKYNTIHIIA